MVKVLEIEEVCMMRKLLVVCLMFFGTPIMAENITLLCTSKNSHNDVYLKFNDEEQTIKLAFKNDFTYRRGEITVHWSDKIIIFASKPLPCCIPTNTYFNQSLNVLDRVKGRLQTVYVSDGNFEKETAKIYLYDCELYDREKPKF